MTDWNAAYNKLYKFLDSYTGSKFMEKVKEIDPDLPSYTNYIKQREAAGQSTTKRDYFKDILLSYEDDIKHYLFELFLKGVGDDNLEDIKAIQVILKGGKPDMRKSILSKALASNEVDSTLLEQTLHGLDAYPDVLKLYKQALTGFNSGKNDRHILDDLRLSVETFLKSLLNNEKSLENQAPALGSYLKGKGVSPEISNTFRNLIDIFSKYNNTYVKHNDQVKSNEIEFVLNLTNIFFRFLLSHN